MRLVLVFFIILFSALNIKAQDDRPLRVEIEDESNADMHRIVPFGEKGVIFFYAVLENKKDQKYKWAFTLYDVNFQKKWRKDVPTELEYKLSDFKSDSNYLYLYLEKKYKSSTTNEFKIIKLNINNSEIKVVEGVNPDNSAITSFEVVGDKAFLGGRKNPTNGQSIGQIFFSITLVPLFSGLTLLKYQPSLIMVDLSSGKVKSLSEPMKGQGYVENIEMFSDKGQAFVSVRNFIQRKTNRLYIDQYSFDGVKTGTIELKSDDPERKLCSMNMLTVSDNEYFIIGTYNNKVRGKQANPAHAGFIESSNGIYLSKTVNNVQTYTKFINFSKFRSFFSSFSDKNAERMKMKARKKEARGGEMSYDYSIIVHDIIVRDSNYILLAELYYPQYRTETYTSYDAYGQPYTTTYTIFEGYRYTSAIIACFDKDGNLKWDNSFDIWNILTFNLGEKVKVLFDGEDIILAYSNEGKIASKVISGDKVIEGNDFTEIQTNYSNDKLLEDYNSDMDYWYGSYFITYGYQKIQNKGLKDKSKRNVFYFNKIAFK
jgi:hypothetical protein